MRYSIPAVLMALAVPAMAFAGPGDLDRRFGGDGRVTTAFKNGRSSAAAVEIQADGKIVAAGSVERRHTFGATKFALARYRRSGRLDPTFGSDGRKSIKFHFSSSARDLALQENGKIVVAGRADGRLDTGFFALARLKPGGELDPTFGGDGKVTTSFASRGAFASAVAVQPDGRIVAAGASFPGDCGGDDAVFALARYKRDGVLDRSFGGDGRVTTEIGGDCLDDTYISALALQPDGKIVVAGSGLPAGFAGGPTFVVARYDAEGTLDPAFGGGDGIVTSSFGAPRATALDVALQSNGRIVAGGKAGSRRFAFARYEQAGAPDVTFDDDGEVTTVFERSAGAEALAIDGDGSIVGAGGADTSFALARYSPAGSLDPTFGGDGVVTTGFTSGSSWAFDLAIALNEKLVAAGRAGRKFALARYIP